DRDHRARDDGVHDERQRDGHGKLRQAHRKLRLTFFSTRHWGGRPPTGAPRKRGFVVGSTGATENLDSSSALLGVRDRRLVASASTRTRMTLKNLKVLTLV